MAKDDFDFQKFIVAGSAGIEKTQRTNDCCTEVSLLFPGDGRKDITQQM
jgi:hypothetical protein